MNSEKFDILAALGGRREIVSDIAYNLPADPFGIDVQSLSSTANCLPMDPFGMEIMPSGPVDPFGTSMKSRDRAVRDWLQEFDEEFESNFSKYGIDEAEKDSVREGLLAGLKMYFSTVEKLEEEKCNLSLDALLIQNHRARRFDCKDNLEAEGGNPHEGLLYVLGYLGVDDLLAVERVCKSLRDAVRGDPLLWRSIHVEYPLNLKLTNEALLGLTSRARGTLQCLTLVECFKITDSGLKQVLDANPSLTTLGIPGCMRLSVQGILSNMRILKSSGILKTRQLIFGRQFSVTNEQFEELKSILDANGDGQQKVSQPHYYHSRQVHGSMDDDNRAMDIEICPKCQKVKLVYDCPSISCKGKDAATDLCRGCTLCISRCIYCGRCVQDPSYEENFCLDFLCLICLRVLLKCEGTPEAMKSIFRKETR